MIAFHPFADVFPLIAGDEFDELVEDIRQNGVRDPIMLLDGKILDGRNRYRALIELHKTGELRGPGWGVYDGEPVGDDDLNPKVARTFRQFSALESGSALEFVVSKNLQRRHLSPSQRGIVAAELARLGWGGDRSKPSKEGMSTEDRARRLNVGRATVERAQTVLDKGEPELKEAVKKGEASVAAAAEIASLPRERQREILSDIAASPDGRKALKDVARSVRAEEQRERHSERQDIAEALTEKNPELPVGRTFSFVLIDVPRHHNVYSDITGSEKAPSNHYPTMRFEELCDFPIDRFAAASAIIAYWSTAASLLDDLDILAEWGFVALRPRDAAGKLIRGDDGKPLPPVGQGRYGSHQIWRKMRSGRQMGTGRWFFDQHELLILARRGEVPAPLPGTQPESVFEADVTDHSTKPGELVRAMIDRQWPQLAKIEVFARGDAPPGWTFWGNQVGTGDGGPPVVKMRPAEVTRTDDDLTIPPFLARKEAS
jgi:N6-adenosine-specific RNA methylase IME4